MVGLDLLIWGVVLFMTLHVAAGFYPIREMLVGKFGLLIFRLVHSIGSIAGMVMIGNGYSTTPREELYYVGELGLKLPIFLMPIALILLVGSRPSSDISRFTRHPMLWAIVLWATGHLFANGDKASAILFGSFLVYGFLAMFLADHKKQKSDPQAWEKLKKHTSVIPFMALLQGRAERPRDDYGLKAFIGGLFLYSLLLWFHGYFTGVSLIRL